jgi:hypothetical protein
MVCAATVQLGVLSRATISTTSTGPATVSQGPLGQVARLAAGDAGPLPGTAASCAAELSSAAVATLGSPVASCAGLTAMTGDAWARVQGAAGLDAGAFTGEQAERRAEKRAAKAARQRAAERRAQRRAAERRAEKRAAERRAEKRAAERARARRAARHARQQATGGGRGWRNAPIVTWYGPGFYGNRTACGVRYTRDIVGVAHRTLPCGTLVEFKWHGITAVAPVIDRGPFASSDYVFDFSAAMSCEVFKPRGIDNACFTRYDVKYRIVGKVALRSYLRRQ